MHPISSSVSSGVWITGKCGAGLRARVPLIMGTFLLLMGFSAGVAAQTTQQRERKPPEPEILKLTTADGVILSARLFPPRNPDRETPIVVLLHMRRRDQKTWDAVAVELQKHNIAAVTLDLRGHGESQDLVDGEKVLLKSFRRDDYLAMVTQDLEVLKLELVKRHNRGQLNIERLALVGAELGATVATLWAHWDWTNAGGQREDYPTVEGGKRGRDVKALVLLSPRYNIEGLRLTPRELQTLETRLAVSIIVGSEDRKAEQDSDRIYKFIVDKRSREDLNHSIGKYRTTLQGTDLLGPEITGPPLPKDLIVKFLEEKLVKELNVAWQQRNTPFGPQP